MSDRSEEAARILADARASIDAIDDELLRLINTRASLVKHVATAKHMAGQAESPFRPAREAMILRRLHAAHRSPLPFTAIAALWRELIASMTALQGRIDVSVYAPVEGSETDRLMALARLHFGSSATIVRRGGIGRMMQDVTGAAHVLGLAAARDADDRPDAWWLACLDRSPEAPRVVAALPFVGAVPQAYVIGTVALEPSGDDVTLFGLRLSEPASRSALIARLARAAPEAVLTASAGDAHLIALPGFHTEAEAAARIAAGLQIAPGDVALAGCYAAPIMEPPV